MKLKPPLTRRVLPLIGALVLVACGMMAQNSNSPSGLLIEVREGGSLEPQPHAAVIKVFTNGRVWTTRSERQATTEEFAEFKKRVNELGALALDQDTLRKEVAETGEAPPGARGGSGVVSLVFFRDGKEVVVSLNRPDHYANSKSPSARSFRESWHLLRRFAATDK